MKPEEIRELLDAEPFVPFRIHLKDGRSYLIARPHQALVTTWSVEVGVPETHAEIRIYDRIAHCSLANIVKIETLQTG